MKIDDPALRAAAIGKFKHSLKLAADLKSEMDGWWASKPVRITQELREDERTLDIVATTDSLPPVEDWSNRINDVFQNLNSALNRLTFAIDKMVGGSAKPDGNYPVHTGDEGWSNWVGKHKDLPSDVLDRYRAFEPFVSGRPGLAFLRRATNAERHEVGFAAAINLDSLALSDRLKVEGLWEPDGLGQKMRVEVGRGFDIVAERSVMFSYIVPTRVLEFDATPSGQIGFAPVVRVDDKEDPYFVVINDVTHEVAWAIAYLTTLAPSSSTPPADLRAVLEV